MIFSFSSKPEVSDIHIVNEIGELKPDLVDIKNNISFNIHDVNVLPKSVYDFHDDSDNRDDEFALKIDESAHKRKRNTSNTKAKALGNIIKFVFSIRKNYKFIVCLRFSKKYFIFYNCY